MSELRLSAFDEEDLGVISAHLQDAVIVMKDVSYRKRERRFALIANRFVWEEATGKQGKYQRRRTGLHFENVMTVKSHRIILGEGEGVLSLLSISFEKGDPPGGEIVLSFSGGGVIRLTVEAIEAWLRDLGPAWTTSNRPGHDR
jgi:hypothetical protein